MIAIGNTRYRSIPIDALVRGMKPGRSYTLGLATTVASISPELADWPEAVARRCADKTDRGTLVIRMPESQCQAAGMSEVIRSREGIDLLAWKPWPAPVVANTPEARARFADLSRLPQWKHRYSLIVIDLGHLDSFAFSGLGKLCDGIGLLANDAQESSRTRHPWVRSLRRHQADGQRLLGIWSLA